MERLADGGYTISDQVDIQGEGTSDFIFARGWLLEIVDLQSGDYYFLSNGREVRPIQELLGGGRS